jgi:hypothetical protein
VADSDRRRRCSEVTAVTGVWEHKRTAGGGTPGVKACPVPSRPGNRPTPRAVLADSCEAFTGVLVNSTGT